MPGGMTWRIADGAGDQASTSQSTFEKFSGTLQMRRLTLFRPDGYDDHCVGRHQIFRDPIEITREVREGLIRRKQRKDPYKDLGIFQAIARNVWFENITFLVIAFNCFWMWYDTEQNLEYVLADADVQFQIAENIFCAYFTFECLVRFLAFKKMRSALRDMWLVFDVILVLITVIDTWVMTFVVAQFDLKSPSGKASGILRLVEVLRLARMMRIIRLIRAVPEFFTLVKGIWTAMRSVACMLLIFAIVLYAFGVGFVQVARGYDMGPAYFSTVSESMLTLLTYGAFQDEISALVADLRRESGFALAAFLIFVLISSITLLNMLVGVLCEAVSLVGAMEREEILVDFVFRSLTEVLRTVTGSDDQVLDEDAFLKVLSSREGIEALEALEVDPAGLTDLRDTLFQADKDGSSATITLSQFVDEVTYLQGRNPATVKDMLLTRRMLIEESRKSADEMRAFMEQVNSRMQDIDTRLRGGPGGGFMQGDSIGFNNFLKSLPETSLDCPTTLTSLQESSPDSLTTPVSLAKKISVAPMSERAKSPVLLPSHVSSPSRKSQARHSHVKGKMSNDMEAFGHQNTAMRSKADSVSGDEALVSEVGKQMQSVSDSRNSPLTESPAVRARVAEDFRAPRSARPTPSVILPNFVSSSPDLEAAADQPGSAVSVTVPDGVLPGSTFKTTLAGVELEVLVPEGCKAGSEIMVTAPATAESSDKLAGEHEVSRLRAAGRGSAFARSRSRSRSRARSESPRLQNQVMSNKIVDGKLRDSKVVVTKAQPPELLHGSAGKVYPAGTPVADLKAILSPRDETKAILRHVKTNLQSDVVNPGEAIRKVLEETKSLEVSKIMQEEV